jgi:protein transport protein SEC20
MPPLPNTYDNEIKDLIESVQRRENDLFDFQIPRLRDCKGPLTVQQNLAAELREDVDILGRQIEVSE